MNGITLAAIPERDNLARALARVEANKGEPGMAGMGDNPMPPTQFSIIKQKINVPLR